LNANCLLTRQLLPIEQLEMGAKHEPGRAKASRRVLGSLSPDHLKGNYMPDSVRRAEQVRFADFEADFSKGELRRCGVLIHIQAKPLTVLATIVQRPGELVSREDLFKALWPNETFVDFDKNLSVAVTKLREVLDDSALQPSYIETVPRRGYRFVGKLEPLCAVAAASANVMSSFFRSPAHNAPSTAEPTSPTGLTPDAAQDLAPPSDSATGRRNWRQRGIWLAAMLLLLAVFAAPHLFSRPRVDVRASPTTVLGGINPEAYQDYNKAKDFSRRWIVDDLKSALIFVDRSIALEPNYAPALSLRASVLTSLADMGVIESDQACNRARADALRAIALEPHLAAGYVSLATIQMGHDWDWGGAETTLATARRMEPNDASTLSAMAGLSRIRGHLDEAIALQKQLVALSPLEGPSYAALGSRLLAAGKLDEALAAQQRAIELDPQLEFVHLDRAMVLLAKGLPNEALREVEEEPGDVWRLLGKVIVLYDLGRTSDSEAALKQLIATHSAEPYVIASAYAYRGERDPAFAWLQRAYDSRDFSLIGIQIDPLFNNLHPDPRFGALVRRMKLSA
jgi:DNA-binding winged helix-turn-helix (wHTH) protein/tetratricopeptide (TPR) repeat protein